MKKYILLLVTLVSVMSFADANTKKILEQYRKEALSETKQAAKEVKEKPVRTYEVSPTVHLEDAGVVEEVTEVVLDEDYEDDVMSKIEKVNFYLRNNPEKRNKLERRYLTVVGQE